MAFQTDAQSGCSLLLSWRGMLEAMACRSPNVEHFWSSHYLRLQSLEHECGARPLERCQAKHERNVSWLSELGLGGCKGRWNPGCELRGKLLTLCP